MDNLPASDPFAVATPEALAALYAAPSQRALEKVVPKLDATARAFIAASPFCILATNGSRGLHATPRGDLPGFVVPLEDGRLAMPDRRGNNRIEALRDILEDPRVALLFLAPGANETLRVNGLARLTADPALKARFAMNGVEPATVILIDVQEVYMQCGRAVLRGKIWAGREAPAAVPTAGEMLASHLNGQVDAKEIDEGSYKQAMKVLY
ncbi:flavin-nucleotide-binding protein [Roseomonas hellenica]|uniref:Flavin-nucleotide-binding protein n=1 Tax=Plastoroseomonas hellenica TaxID=2687306 RepID=A0ABS5F8X4_9PROT|nr:MSMEG_1061 family FMN-dependent PPOX-type flavoprotein [Plastoroseomonas hellenica]MBR0668936.1 flavin-nucleotide-binding protein [Plastoroseomonas hellenica]